MPLNWKLKMVKMVIFYVMSYILYLLCYILARLKSNVKNVSKHLFACSILSYSLNCELHKSRAQSVWSTYYVLPVTEDMGNKTD